MSWVTASDWLEYAEEELELILTSLMQVPDGSKSKFFDVVLGKVAATSTGVGILGLVGTFGTASTGTAIASLSGAAATSSQLAWMGGLIGGGVFAGTLLTGGLGIAAGYFAIQFLNGRPREPEQLNKIEQNIFASCSYFLKAVKDEQVSRSASVAQIRDFSRQIQKLCANIDGYMTANDNKENFSLASNLAPRHMWNLTQAVNRLDDYCDEFVS